MEIEEYPLLEGIRTVKSSLNFSGMRLDNNEMQIGETSEEKIKITKPLTLDEIEKMRYKSDDTSINNGGKTDYYQISNAPFLINDFDDFAEWRNLNGNQFNMGKVMWAFNVGRHDGTNYERELNKIIHYANRELLRLKRK